MSIIKFPGAEKKNAPKKMSDSEKKFLIDGIIEALDGVDEVEAIDFSTINEQLFKKYISQFPCFETYNGSIDIKSLYSCFEDTGNLNDSQELAFVYVLELISDYDFGFMLKDVFEIWSKEDQAAFIKIIAAHSLFVEQ